MRASEACQEPARAPPAARQSPVTLGNSRRRAHIKLMTCDALIDSLQRLADLLSEAQDPWWVLGSAAVALKGYDPGRIGDIDVLISERDAAHLMVRFGLENEADGGTPQYRSTYFLKPELGAIEIEVMAGYQIKHGSEWHSVWPTSRQCIDLDRGAIFVPSDAELLDLFHRLGREKDLARIRAMNPL